MPGLHLLPFGNYLASFKAFPPVNPPTCPAVWPGYDDSYRTISYSFVERQKLQSLHHYFGVSASSTHTFRALTPSPSAKSSRSPMSTLSRRRWHFWRMKIYNLRPEVADELMSIKTVDDVGAYVPVKYGCWRSKVFLRYLSSSLCLVLRLF